MSESSCVPAWNMLELVFLYIVFVFVNAHTHTHSLTHSFTHSRKQKNIRNYECKYIPRTRACMCAFTHACTLTHSLKHSLTKTRKYRKIRVPILGTKVNNMASRVEGLFVASRARSYIQVSRLQWRGAFTSVSELTLNS